MTRRTLRRRGFWQTIIEGFRIALRSRDSTTAANANGTVRPSAAQQTLLPAANAAEQPAGFPDLAEQSSLELPEQPDAEQPTAVQIATEFLPAEHTAEPPTESPAVPPADLLGNQFAKPLAERLAEQPGSQRAAQSAEERWVQRNRDHQNKNMISKVHAVCKE